MAIQSTQDLLMRADSAGKTFRRAFQKYSTVNGMPISRFAWRHECTHMHAFADLLLCNEPQGTGSVMLADSAKAGADTTSQQAKTTAWSRV